MVNPLLHFQAHLHWMKISDALSDHFLLISHAEHHRPATGRIFLACPIGKWNVYLNIFPIVPGVNLAPLPAYFFTTQYLQRCISGSPGEHKAHRWYGGAVHDRLRADPARCTFEKPELFADFLLT